MVGNAPSSLRYLFPINPTRIQIKMNIPTPRVDLFRGVPLEFASIVIKNTVKQFV